MKTFVSCLVGFSLVISFMACAKPPVILDRVLVKNATTGKITDVKIRHEPAKKFGSVNAILPGEALEIGLSSMGNPMLAEQALVYWRDGDGVGWTTTLDLPYDQSVAEKKHPVKLVYVIYPSGRATVHLGGL
jgi:hypothetical protein